MSTAKNKNHVYDYAIIGSGLAGLSIAATISQKTENVILLDGADVFGGSNRPIQFPTGVMNNGLRILPETPSARQSLEFLENVTGYKIAGETLSAPIQTFENGGFKQFLGFQDEAPEFYDELAYFLCSERIDMKLEPHQWPQLLMSRYRGEFSPRSYVTRFNVENEQVVSVMVNGSKVTHAQNFIYCGGLRELAILVPEEVLGVKTKTKLAKNKYWTAVCLDLCHNHIVTEANHMHMLNGTTQDDLGPSAGVFLPPVQTEHGMIQTSQWVTFLDFESTEESEFIAAALKKVKRQIKRAYPQATEGLVTERIFISPIIGGQGDLKLTAHQTLPKAQNLWIGSPCVHPQKNLVGCLQQSKLVLASLGFETEEFKETTSELGL